MRKIWSVVAHQRESGVSREDLLGLAKNEMSAKEIARRYMEDFLEDWLNDMSDDVAVSDMVPELLHMLDDSDFKKFQSLSSRFIVIDQEYVQ